MTRAEALETIANYLKASLTEEQWEEFSIRHPGEANYLLCKWAHEALRGAEYELQRARW